MNMKFTKSLVVVGLILIAFAYLLFCIGGWMNAYHAGPPMSEVMTNVEMFGYSGISMTLIGLLRLRYALG